MISLLGAALALGAGSGVGKGVGSIFEDRKEVDRFIAKMDDWYARRQAHFQATLQDPASDREADLVRTINQLRRRITDLEEHISAMQAAEANKRYGCL